VKQGNWEALMFMKIMEHLKIICLKTESKCYQFIYLFAYFCSLNFCSFVSLRIKTLIKCLRLGITNIQFSSSEKTCSHLSSCKHAINARKA